jgi:hypothetical protein
MHCAQHSVNPLHKYGAHQKCWVSQTGIIQDLQGFPGAEHCVCQHDGKSHHIVVQQKCVLGKTCVKRNTRKSRVIPSPALSISLSALGDWNMRVSFSAQVIGQIPQDTRHTLKMTGILATHL